MRAIVFPRRVFLIFVPVVLILAVLGVPIVASANSAGNPALAVITLAPNRAAVAESGVAIQAPGGNSTVSANGASSPVLVSLTISPRVVKLPQGLTQQFTAAGKYSDNSRRDLTREVTWGTSNPAVMSIASGGLAKAANQGKANISANLGNIHSTVLTAVTPPVIVSLSVSPATASIALGLTQQFTATATYTNGATENVTTGVGWNSSNTQVATVLRGLTTSVSAGSATITAYAGTIQSAAALTVSPPKLISINVTPPTATIPLGNTQQFTATGNYSNGTQQNITQSVTWSSSNTNIANVGNSPNGAGLATGEGVGNCAIQASLGSISGMAQLTVQTGAKLTVTVIPQQVSLTLTEPQQYQAYVQGTTNQNVSWLIDGIPGGNSTVGTISSSGLYTPPMTAGSHVVTADSQADPTYSGTGSLWVTNYAGMFNYRNDQQSTGQDLNEPALSAQNVQYKTFGKLFSCPVDGYVYGQPLYVANYSIAGGTHNVVIVATENDSVYAFDADNPSCETLWQVSFLTNGVTPIPDADMGNGECTEIVPQLGITGTPVIDLANNTVFVLASTLEGPPRIASSYFHRVHALNLATGQEQPGSPVAISASVIGAGAGSQDGMLSFDPQMHKSRTALQLVNGVLYFAFGSDCDVAPFHGWVFAYDEFQLTQLAAYCTTANGSDGGIWMTGGGVTFDADGNGYVPTANGTFDGNMPGLDYGDTLLKFVLSGNSLRVLDYFTPYNQANLEENNLDLSTFAPVLLPDQPGNYPHLIVGAGKQGIIYVLNRDSLGHYNPYGDTQIVQELRGVMNYNFSTPTYWNENVYFGSASDFIKAFSLNNGLLSSSWTSRSPAKIDFPGTTMSISASSATANKGILWALDNSGFGALGQEPSPAILHAYNSNNLADELYNSTQAPNNRDQADDAVKFTVPTVANGKVYFGTETALDVFGLLPGQPPKK